MPTKDHVLRGLRSSGSPIRSSIVIAVARGIVNHKKNPSLLKEHGGQVELSKSWAKSFLDRLGYVKRKGTKTARKIPEDFPNVKAAFLDKVKTAKSYVTSLEAVTHDNPIFSSIGAVDDFLLKRAACGSLDLSLPALQAKPLFQWKYQSRPRMTCLL